MTTAGRREIVLTPALPQTEYHGKMMDLGRYRPKALLPPTSRRRREYDGERYLSRGTKRPALQLAMKGNRAPKVRVPMKSV
jgi:hypothetical protein